MTNRPTYLFGLIGMALLASSLPAHADDKVDCVKLFAKNCRKDLTMDPNDVRQCIMRGYDAPLTCRKNEGKSAGVRVEGTSGFSYGTIQSPAHNPGAMGASPTVDPKTIGKAFGYPPWPGYPCVLPGNINLCAPGGPPKDTTPVDEVCPQKSSTLFGDKITLGTTALSAPCGTAVALTTYELTLNKNSDRMASTEQNSFFIWFYKRSGNTFTAVNNPRPPTVINPNPPPFIIPNPDRAAFPLPTYLCSGNKKTVDLTPPIAQMIMYNASTQSLLIRLKSRETLSPIADPALIPPYDPDEPEKYLVIPIVGGNPQIPGNCAQAATYWKTIDTMRSDIIIEAGSDGGCEGTAQQCAGMCESGTPPSQCISTPVAATPPQNCEFVTLDLTGNCAGKTQYVVLDRPNIVYPANATIAMLGIQNRTAKLAPSMIGSYLFTQASETIRLGPTAPSVTLEEGGTLNYVDGSTLQMEAPATVNAATGQVILTGGGLLKDAGGSLVQDFPSGTTYTPSGTIKPWTINIERSMTLPDGYLLPTEPNPQAKMPVVE